MHGHTFKCVAMDSSALRTLGSMMLRKFKANSATFELLCARNYAAQVRAKENIEKKEKKVHPYKSVHPWKSLEEFSKDLVDQVIYNENGLVVLNKPYGISGQPHRKRQANWKSVNTVPHGVDYTISDAIPYIAKDLGHPSLIIAKTPERYISGVTVLTTSENIEKYVDKALARALPAKIIPKTHWVITTKLPKHESGSKNLAINLKRSPCKTFSQPLLHTTWRNNAVKRLEMKLLNVEFRQLSSSMENQCALLEIKSSTTKWHALRVFLATVLYSPILGDNIHGSRVQNVMGTDLTISAFSEAARRPPKLKPELLEKLDLIPGQEVIIPAHIHLRQMRLVSFLPGKKDLILTAPLPREMSWTCDKLQLNTVFEDNEDQIEHVVTDL